MIIPEIKINQLVTIEIKEDEYSKKKLPSRIEEVFENSIHISMPSTQGNLLLLHNGDRISLLFTTNNGVFSADSKVIARKAQPIPTLVIEKPTEYTNVGQKREHVRLDVTLPVTYRTEDQELYASLSEFEKGITDNVSAGGVFFTTVGQVEPGQRLKLEIQLSDKDIMNCKADVRRVTQPKNSELRTIGVGVQFYNISQNQIDYLYKYIFNKQRDWIKRGLL